MSFHRSRLAIAALFCFLGFQYSTWVSQIPAFRDRLHLDEADVGLFLLAPGIGATVSYPLVARLMRRWGSRRLAGVSALVLLAVLLGLAAAPSFPVALVVLVVDGLAVGCLNVAMNAQGAALEAAFERNTMARLHAVFSGGILAGALLTAAVTAAGGGQRVHFAVGAVLLTALLALSRDGTFREDHQQPAAAPESPRWRLPGRVTVLLTLAMVFAELTEGAMNDWSALYLRDVAGAPAGLTPMGIAAFAGTMLVTRLFADRWRSRWGDQAVVTAGAALAAAGLAVALLAGGVVTALLGFAAVGLGMAAVTPCIYVAAARVAPETLSLVASVGTVGLLAGPPIIGFVASATSLVGGLTIVVGAAALVAACVGALSWPRPPEITAADKRSGWHEGMITDTPESL
ncbi:MFS transporter [Actinoplanes regularis]|uniref:MFS transporter n=1 Tax=Actinoplanes regularis TaxID=52697 RepID=UPI0024A58618|nr:MFS transporter [Actinoplanes regularis]GLW27571.1 MFS transporter [Actinoplanes regularis]